MRFSGMTGALKYFSQHGLALCKRLPANVVAIVRQNTKVRVVAAASLTRHCARHRTAQRHLNRAKRLQHQEWPSLEFGRRSQQSRVSALNQSSPGISSNGVIKVRQISAGK